MKTETVDTIYAWVSVDEDENEKVINVNIADRNFPGVMRSLDAAKDLEPMMNSVREKSGHKVMLKKFTDPSVVRRL